MIHNNSNKFNHKMIHNNSNKLNHKMIHNNSKINRKNKSFNNKIKTKI